MNSGILSWMLLEERAPHLMRNSRWLGVPSQLLTFHYITGIQNEVNSGEIKLLPHALEKGGSEREMSRVLLLG